MLFIYFFSSHCFSCFFFIYSAPPQLYPPLHTRSLPYALPISWPGLRSAAGGPPVIFECPLTILTDPSARVVLVIRSYARTLNFVPSTSTFIPSTATLKDRKSTRLNSSH